MAAELQPSEAPIDSETAATATVMAVTTTTSTTEIVPVQTDYLGQIPAPPKRQRRPSVRLGEIGDQPATLTYDTQMRSANRYKHPSWRLPRESSKSSKARSLTNLVNGNNNDTHGYNYDEKNQNGELTLEFGHPKAKARRVTTKRVRSNWISSRVDETDGNGREEGDEAFRDFAPDSESPSPLKDPSPVHSADNLALDMWHSVPRRPSRTRVSESKENDAVEMDNLHETDSRDQKCGTSEDVRTWLIELGLSRYAPVFELHEVDDEVLPLLTLEDLKDMGINAVGSRRKIYTAIQKLRKGFS